MSEDRLTRALVSAASAAPSQCGDYRADPVPESLVWHCAEFLQSEIESDVIGLEWGVLEGLNDAGWRYLPTDRGVAGDQTVSDRMKAIDARQDALSSKSKRHLKALRRIKPANAHEVASLLVIAAQMQSYDPPPSGVFLVAGLAHFAKGRCPICGAPYVPACLTRS